MNRLSPRPPAIDPRHVPRKPDAIRVTLTLAAMVVLFFYLLLRS